MEFGIHYMYACVCIYQADCVTNSIGRAGSMADWLLVMNL